MNTHTIQQKINFLWLYFFSEHYIICTILWFLLKIIFFLMEIGILKYDLFQVSAILGKSLDYTLLEAGNASP